MYDLKKFQNKKTYNCNFAPWAKIIPPGIILNKDGSFMAVILYRGPDLDNETVDRLNIITAQLNELIMTQFTTGYVLYWEATREIVNEYDEDVYFPDPITKEIDNRRRKIFINNANNFESKYYITIYYYPPSDTENKLKNLMIEEHGSDKKELSIEDCLNNFKNKIDTFVSTLKEIGLPFVEVADSNQIATYLHNCISNKKHSIVVPDKENQFIPENQNINLLNTPTFIDNLIFDTPLIGGFNPKLGNEYIKVIVPLNFPPTSFFGMFNGLNMLNFEYRWITRFFCMNKQDTIEALDTYNKGWKGKVVPITKAIKEMIFGHPDMDGSVNENALSKVEEIKSAKFDVGEDKILYGYYSLIILVKDKNKSIAENKAKEVMQYFINMGINAKIEDINAVDAYFATLPGNIYNHVRRPLISTGNLVQMVPFTNIWAGKKRNKHLNAPPLIYTKTIGNTPFRLNLHIGDVGHSMVIGPTGSGKSVHLCLIEAQFRKYKDAQIFIFDKGSSSKVITTAVGGEFYDLGSEEITNSISFQPFRKIDSDRELSWLLEWLCDYLVQENIKITPEVKQTIHNALLDMRTYQGDYKRLRTMSTFTGTLQNSDLRRAFEPLTSNGAFGRIFDSNEENLKFSSWQAFEMENLMNTKSIVGPTLMYLFHRIEESLNGNPTIIVLDECWTFFDNPSFAKKIKEWLKVLRKYNASVIFATQSLADIRNSSIFNTILDSCGSRIFLPNPNIYSGDNPELYKSFGLNDKKIQIIGTAIPKRQYYYDSIEGSRLYELALDKFTLAYIAVNKKDLINANQIIMQHGKENFNKYWQEYKGV